MAFYHLVGGMDSQTNYRCRDSPIQLSCAARDPYRLWLVGGSAESLLNNMIFWKGELAML